MDVRSCSRFRFPLHNRITSGLSAAVVLIVAFATRGLFGIAARAVVQDRTVSVVPGYLIDQRRSNAAS